MITVIMILSMNHDHTTNIIEAVLLMIGLFIFAGFIIRSENINAKKKDFIKL
jgi:Flp pilus assembly protein protease CpaA